MMEIQERMLEYIDEVYESTGGGFPTAGMVARAVGVDEQTTTIFLMDLVRRDILITPRFGRKREREATGSERQPASPR
jgi:Mn-dependent DtxR family transcriptional regulator